MKRSQLSNPPHLPAKRNKREDTAQDHIIIFPKIFRHITLCDIKSLTEATGVQYSPQFGLNIEECCLRAHPVDSSPDIYKKYGAITVILTLQEITEAEALKILKFFFVVKDLTMRKMTILEGRGVFPGHLAKLTIVNCQVEESFMLSWFRKLGKTLEHLHLHNLVYSYLTYHIQTRIYLGKCMKLTSIIVQGKSWQLNFNGPKVKFLHLTAKERSKGLMKCPNLNELHFDVPSTPTQIHQMFKYAKSSLEKLTIRNWIDPIHLAEFTALNHFEVLAAVPIWKKGQVEAMDIRQLKMHFEPTSADPDLIFDMLNEYCLLEIIGYLPPRDWIQFATLHPRVECAVSSYKYPRAQLSVLEFPLKIFKNIAPLLKNFNIWHHSGKLKRLSGLKSLSLSVEFSGEILRSMPTRLEKLTLYFCKNMNVADLSSYFQQLNTTLRVLEIGRYRSLNEECLLKFGNLREIELSPLDSIESIEILKRVLEQNQETLERVDISFWRLGNCGTVLNVIKKMAKLKVLRFTDFREDSGIAEIRDMFTLIGPQLKRLSLENPYHQYHQEITADVLPAGSFDELQDFEVYSTCMNDRRMIKILKSMKKLRKLRSAYPLTDDILIELFVALPHLSEVILGSCRYTPIGRELCQFLKEANRTVRIRLRSIPNEPETRYLFVDLP